MVYVNTGQEDIRPRKNVFWLCRFAEPTFHNVMNIKKTTEIVIYNFYFQLIKYNFLIGSEGELLPTLPLHNYKSM